MRLPTAAGSKTVFREVASGAETDRVQLRHPIASGGSWTAPFALASSSHSQPLRSAFTAHRNQAGAADLPQLPDGLVNR